MATMVASVPGWTEPREWEKYPEQTSQPIRLRAGEYYTLDALVKENTGGDNLAVGVTLPNGTHLRPIPVEGLLFVDPVMHRSAMLLTAGDSDSGTGSAAAAAAAASGGGSGRQQEEALSEYQSCMGSVRAQVVHCGTFLLWRLPDVSSCDPVAMAYCSVPSALFPL